MNVILHSIKNGYSNYVQCMEYTDNDNFINCDNFNNSKRFLMFRNLLKVELTSKIFYNTPSVDPRQDHRSHVATSCK